MSQLPLGITDGREEVGGNAVLVGLGAPGLEGTDIVAALISGFPDAGVQGGGRPEDPEGQ